MNIGLAFTYIFKDKEWVSKSIIGIIFIITSFLIIPGLLITGYYLKIINEVKHGNEDRLPNWADWGDLIVSGFKFLIVNFIYALPIIIIMIILFGFMILPAILTDQSGNETLPILFMPLYIIFQVLVTFISIIYGYIVIPAITILFVQTERISQTLRIGQVYLLIKNNLADLAIIAGMMFLLGYLSQIGIIFFIIGIFVASFYTMTVLAHLEGQLSRKIFN